MTAYKRKIPQSSNHAFNFLCLFSRDGEGGLQLKTRRGKRKNSGNGKGVNNRREKTWASRRGEAEKEDQEEAEEDYQSNK